MDPRELEAYLHQHIPLSQAMQASVVLASPDRVVLRAPLAPNINHRDTVFGGSSASLAMLASWLLLLVRLESEGLECRLVVQRGTMSYALPIAGDFTATASISSHKSWTAFTRTLERRRRARIKVAAVLEHGGKAACQFEGEFVALASSGSGRS